MSEVFLGQIMTTAFDFAPRGFALCNGQLMPISQNQALFSLLGTIYGGDGRTTFALPDMRGRTPMGAGSSVDPGWQSQPHQIGQRGGSESVTLTDANLPAHSHQPNAVTAAGATRNPTGSLYGTASSAIYAPANSGQVPLHTSTVASAGGSSPHNNMQPYLTINYCISLNGTFPSRN